MLLFSVLCKQSCSELALASEVKVIKSCLRALRGQGIYKLFFYKDILTPPAPRLRGVTEFEDRLPFGLAPNER